MSYLGVIEQIEQRGEVAPSMEGAGPLIAVQIVNSVVGDYWLILDETEPFDPGDDLPLYRPSEIRALAGKGYGPEDLLAVHRAKVALAGRVIR